MLGVIIYKWNDRVENLLWALKQATKTSLSMVPSIWNCSSLGCVKDYLVLGMQLFPSADHGECASKYQNKYPWPQNHLAVLLRKLLTQNCLLWVSYLKWENWFCMEFLFKKVFPSEVWWYCAKVHKWVYNTALRDKLEDCLKTRHLKAC